MAQCGDCGLARGFPGAAATDKSGLLPADPAFPSPYKRGFGRLPDYPLGFSGRSLSGARDLPGCGCSRGQQLLGVTISDQHSHSHILRVPEPGFAQIPPKPNPALGMLGLIPKNGMEGIGSLRVPEEGHSKEGMEEKGESILFVVTLVMDIGINPASTGIQREFCLSFDLV